MAGITESAVRTEGAPWNALWSEFDADAASAVSIDAVAVRPTLSLATSVGAPPVVESQSLWQRSVTRVFDLSLAIPALIIFLPVMTVVALAVRLTSRGPVIYRSRRITRSGREFEILKFRSMVLNGEAVLERHLAQHPESRVEWERDHKLRDDPRVTRIGAFSRRWSLDELPQLFNVLMGDMSVVGPRPLTLDEYATFDETVEEICQVKGGLTCIWQVSGRSLLSFDERVPLDLRYVRTRSLRGDIDLIVRTLDHFARGCPGAF